MVCGGVLFMAEKGWDELGEELKDAVNGKFHW